MQLPEHPSVDALIRTLVLGSVMLWIGGCHSVRPQAGPVAHSRPSGRPLRAAIKTPPPSFPPRSPEVPERKSPLPVPQAVPPSTITLDKSDAAKADAQRLLEETSVKLAHINRADLTDNTASVYNQANELMSAAYQAAAEHDYLAATGLAQKASALASQLPRQTSR